AADAKALSDAVQRDVDKARTNVAGPQDVRVKALETLVKKQQQDLEGQKKQTNDARVREEAARRTTEQVRQQDQRTIEQVRQEGQRTIEQIRQESQRAIEKMRQELNQARAEAQRQKQLADEAK